MKQRILFLLVLGLAGHFLAAQDMEFTVSPVIVENVASTDFEGIGYSQIANTATATRNLTWSSNAIEITEGWTFAICDKNLCYGSDVTTQPFELATDEAGRMDVHAYPNNRPGSAIIEVTITDDANANLSVSNLYYFNTSPNSTTEASRQTVKVYPNPSNGLFSVKGAKQIAQVEILSLTGRQVKSFTYNDGQWYDISDLPKGTYLVRLIDRDARQLVTKLINKL